MEPGQSSKSIDFSNEILEELRLIKQEIRKNSLRISFKRQFLLSVISGFGAIVGATILVSLLVLILKQFATIEILEPFIQKIIEIVQKSK